MGNDSIIKFTDTSIESLTIEDIHRLLLNKISEVYGVTVDPLGWSADSIYQKILAKYFSDFSQVAKDSYDMLNIDIATGSRLDNLVSVLGVKRKSNSYAQIEVKVNDSREVDVHANHSLSFMDSSGAIWVAVTRSAGELVPKTGEIKLNKPLLLLRENYGEVTRESIGVRFTSMWITNYTNTDYQVNYLVGYDLTIDTTDGEVKFFNQGSRFESDDELRNRFKSMNITGLSSNTLEDSLKANLINNVDVIDDVMIISNPSGDLEIDNSDFGATASGEVIIVKNNVLPLIKTKYGSNVDPYNESLIMETIRKKLPLGIGTENGFPIANFTTLNKVYAPTPTTLIPYRAIVAKPISPKIRIKLNVTFESDDLLSDVQKLIRTTLQEYSKGFKISQPIVLDDLRNRIFQTNVSLGNPTYRVETITINNVATDFDTQLQYWLVNNINTDIVFE